MKFLKNNVIIFIENEKRKEVNKIMQISVHSKKRIVQRVQGVENFHDAKRMAKQAKISGKTIDYYSNCPKFFHYLQYKSEQTHECRVRIYKDNIFIWHGKSQTLVTAHPIPKRFQKEIDKNYLKF